MMGHFLCRMHARDVVPGDCIRAEAQNASVIIHQAPAPRAQTFNFSPWGLGLTPAHEFHVTNKESGKLYARSVLALCRCRRISFVIFVTHDMSVFIQP